MNHLLILLISKSKCHLDFYYLPKPREQSPAYALLLGCSSPCLTARAA